MTGRSGESAPRVSVASPKLQEVMSQSNFPVEIQTIATVLRVINMLKNQKSAYLDACTVTVEWFFWAANITDNSRKRDSE